MRIARQISYQENGAAAVEFPHVLARRCERFAVVKVARR